MNTANKHIEQRQKKENNHRVVDSGERRERNATITTKTIKNKKIHRVVKAGERRERADEVNPGIVAGGHNTNLDKHQ